MQPADERDPRALFLSAAGQVLADDRVCSGLEAPALGGRPCPHAEGGRMPSLQPIDAGSARRWPERGRAGDLAPPCAAVQLGSLAGWLGARTGGHPDHLLGLRLFRCRQWFLMVVPGLHDGAPDRLTGPGGEAPMPPG